MEETHWDLVLSLLSLIDVINLQIADPDLSKFVIRKILSEESSKGAFIIPSKIVPFLLSSNDPDQILDTWGTNVKSLAIQGYSKESENEWQRILPHFINLTKLRLCGARLSSPTTVKCLPIGLTYLAMQDCSIPPPILRPWLRKLNPTLTRLYFQDFDEDDRSDHPQEEWDDDYPMYDEDTFDEERGQRGKWLTPFRALKNVTQLYTDQVDILKYLPTTTLNRLLMRQVQHLDYLNEKQWNYVLLAPELEYLRIGFASLPDLKIPRSVYKDVEMGIRSNDILWNYMPAPLLSSKLTRLYLDHNMFFEFKTIAPLVNLKILHLRGYTNFCKILELTRMKKLEELICDCANMFAKLPELLTLVKNLDGLRMLAMATSQKLEPITNAFVTELDGYLASVGRQLQLQTLQTDIVSPVYGPNCHTYLILICILL